jgi:DNA-binding transcriptional regulator YiaG
MAKKKRKRDPKHEWTPVRIKALRKMLDLTQEEFADKLHISRRTVAAWEDSKTEHWREPPPVVCLMLEAIEQGKYKL